MNRWNLDGVPSAQCEPVPHVVLTYQGTRDELHLGATPEGGTPPAAAVYAAGRRTDAGIKDDLEQAVGPPLLLFIFRTRLLLHDGVVELSVDASPGSGQRARGGNAPVCQKV